MVATGIGFAREPAFVPLLVVAVVGTLNPSAGDVSVFLPTEQAVLAGAVDAERDARRSSPATTWRAPSRGRGARSRAGSGPRGARVGLRLVVRAARAFVAYAAIADRRGGALRGLDREPATRRGSAARERTVPLRRARVAWCSSSPRSSASIRSAAASSCSRSSRSGCCAASRCRSRTIGAVFFAAGLLASFSQLVVGAARRPHRTRPDHGVHPHSRERVPRPRRRSCRRRRWRSCSCSLRMALSQMDVPARQSYVMAVVPPEERAAAASVTNVPRSLAAALRPCSPARCCTARTSAGRWFAGRRKIAYDAILFALFRNWTRAPPLLARLTRSLDAAVVKRAGLLGSWAGACTAARTRCHPRRPFRTGRSSRARRTNGVARGTRSAGRNNWRQGTAAGPKAGRRTSWEARRTCHHCTRCNTRNRGARERPVRRESPGAHTSRAGAARAGCRYRR